MSFGPTELIIILVIVILLFGIGRISKIAGEMGSGIRAFKKGMQGDEEKDADASAKNTSGDDNTLPPAA
jgi:sec-independent protein translocase protein TatA